jgi:hypothetical protein
LPSFCCSDWVLFKEAKVPVFIVDGGVHIPKLESAKITYAGYFDPVADTTGALIKMRLRCKCCINAQGQGINFHNVTARGDASSFSNAAEHLLACTGNPPLTLEDSLKRAEKKKPMVLAAAQEGARIPTTHRLAGSCRRGRLTATSTGRPWRSSSRSYTYALSRCLRATATRRAKTSARTRPRGESRSRTAPA